MSKKKHDHEEHVDESWLIPYADILTLLLALFIVLFAQSQTDKSKIEQLSTEFQNAFNGTSGLMTQPSMTKDETSRKQVTADENKMMKSVSENSDLRATKEKIDQKIEEQGLENKVSTSLNQDGLTIILTDEVLFSSGDAKLRSEHLQLIDAIAFILGDLENPVKMNGFTDNQPINNSIYPSNWELSTARSTSVLKYILDKNPRLEPTRFSSSGFGEYKPIADNSTVEGRKLNRRVEIVVTRMYGEGLMQPKGGAINE
jgi:chemotaxis protein MotB